MFNSFVDGTKSAIEMAAVCNATGLEPQEEGLRFPGCSRESLVALPERLSRSGTVEVVAAEDLRWGVFVVFTSGDELARRSLVDYGAQTSTDGRYAALYRPFHLVGLELAVSVLQAGLRGRPTGSPTGFRADVVAVAKRDLPPGTVLDGEGGYCVYGVLVPAARWGSAHLLPIGLSSWAVVREPIAAGEVIPLEHVELKSDEVLLALREETLGDP